MAILLAFSNERFLKVIQKEGEPNSLFMQAVAAFFHFLVLQTSALTVALISTAYSNHLLSAIGFFLLAYGMLSALAVGGALLQISRVFNAVGGIKGGGEKKDETE